MIKAALIDFDGTLVTRDMLDVLCGIMGKQAESERINEAFQAGLRDGISSLVERVHFLQGVTLPLLYAVLKRNAYLRSGAKELVDFLKERRIITILHSGNIAPVLAYYQKMLGISYIVGTEPKIDGDAIVGFHVPERGFKLRGIGKIVNELSIKPGDCLAIGDSPADKTVFAYAGTSIAVAPRNGVEKYATYAIRDDLREAIPIIQKLI